MSIESKGYVATVADITELSRSMFDAEARAVGSRQTYLRALVATTQAELGTKPRQRSASKPAKLKPEAVESQLAALTAVHGKFYDAVCKAAAKDLPTGKERAKELNRRTNFARSSMSMARGYIRAGNDICACAVAKLTKAALAVERATRAPSPTRLKTQVESKSKAFTEALEALADQDKEAATNELRLLIGTLTSQLIELGEAPVKSPVEAAIKGRPLKAEGRIFFPAASSRLS